jgi:hypothetical protein
MAKRWPVRLRTPDGTNITLTTSKSAARSSIHGGNKSSLKLGDNDILHQTFSHLRSKNVLTPNSSGPGDRKTTKNRIMSTESESSLVEFQQRNEWNLKAQEGVITYRLPDALPDGVALQNKLEKLMKTDTIHLNDRHFWSKLENRFTKLRKVFSIFTLNQFFPFNP